MDAVDHKKAMEILEGKRMIPETHHKHRELCDLNAPPTEVLALQDQIAKLNDRLTGLGKFINEGLERLGEQFTLKAEGTTRVYTRQPNMSENIGDITKALAAARKEIGIVHKGSAANRGNFSSQVDLSAACEPILEANGITATFLIDYNEYNELVIVLILSHSSGQWMRSSAPLREEFALSPKEGYHQRVGAAEKYMRRYMYRAMLCIAEE